LNESRQQPGTHQAPPVESLQGVVERLTYHSAESGYTVARLKAPRTSELITITGSFATIQAGQTLQLQGIWKDHPKFGAQFQVTQYRETKPATITGIEKYLGSGLIKGVGYVTAKRIVAHFGLETTRGEVGTRNLNMVLQQLINPPSPNKSEIVRAGMILRVGDRVIQKVNDYNREVFNGDLGMIAAVDVEEQEVVVQFGQRSVSYDYADLNEITLAWAVTIHKSQGSEYPVVILPIYMQHYMMLSRNLIYTGLTRAKRLAIVVGPQKAIALAVRQVKDRQRYTLLGQRLQAKR